jgi:hypothetical protein
VRPVCDGRVVSERGSASETSGDGFTIRCYMPDGSLSNLYVTYNHIQAGTVENLLGLDVRLNTELGLNVYQYTDRQGNIVAPHLHLEVFYTQVANNLRLNPLLFFGTTVPGIEMFYRPRNDVPEDQQAYDYYPVDSVANGEEKRFEWWPYDQIDRPRSDRRWYSETAADYRYEDYDLNISTANNEWAVSGDLEDVSSEQPWDRIASQNGSPIGLQDIDNAQIEWPAQDRLMLSVGSVLQRMRELTP